MGSIFGACLQAVLRCWQGGLSLLPSRDPLGLRRIYLMLEPPAALAASVTRSAAVDLDLRILLYEADGSTEITDRAAIVVRASERSDPLIIHAPSLAVFARRIVRKWDNLRMSAEAWSAIIAGSALFLSIVGFWIGEARHKNAERQRKASEDEIRAARQRAAVAEQAANEARSKAAEAQEKIADFLGRQGQVPERDLVIIRGSRSDEFELANEGDRNYEGVTVIPPPGVQELTKFPEQIYILARDRSPGWRMRAEPGAEMPDHLMVLVANHGDIWIRIPPPSDSHGRRVWAL